jgi:hypothetical protein
MTPAVDQIDQAREGIDVRHSYTRFGWTVFFSKYLSSYAQFYQVRSSE